jgi:F-type H+-transporting ATPase subunit a
MVFADAFDHVVNSDRWDFFETQRLGFHLPFGLTKFVILEMLAALLILAIFIPLAKRAASGQPPTGVWWNMFEVLLTFIRDRVAKPAFGEHEADTHVPFLWTVFLFILFCNLFGLIPFLASPTASLAVTGVLAVFAFLAIHVTACVRQGPWHYLKSHYPHIQAPFGLSIPIAVFIVFIELMGHFIKAFVLAVRLFANLFAGHLVLAFILYFIVLARATPIFLFGPITVGSVLMVTALSLLELFIAFLQAYIFTFLTALFMGMALHPHH